MFGTKEEYTARPTIKSSIYLRFSCFSVVNTLLNSLLCFFTVSRTQPANGTKRALRNSCAFSATPAFTLMKMLDKSLRVAETYSAIVISTLLSIKSKRIFGCLLYVSFLSLISTTPLGNEYCPCFSLTKPFRYCQIVIVRLFPSMEIHSKPFGANHYSIHNLLILAHNYPYTL